MSEKENAEEWGVESHFIWQQGPSELKPGGTDMQESGGRAFQAEGTTSAKALGQERGQKRQPVAWSGASQELP